MAPATGASPARVRAAMRAARRRLKAALFRDAIPDPGGLVSFCLLLVALSAMLYAANHPEVALAGGAATLLPRWLRGPGADAAADAFAQASVFVLPGAAAYWGVRHLRTRGDSAVPFLTVLGGASITAILLVAVVVAWWTAVPAGGA